MGLKHPPVAMVMGGYHPALLGLLLGEGPAMLLSSCSENLGYLPAFLWHVYGCCCALGLFYTEVSLPPPIVLPISFSPDVSGFYVGKHVLTAC